MQQPAQSRRLHAPHPAPAQVLAILRPSQRHIEQAQLLRQQLAARRQLHPGVGRGVRRQPGLIFSVVAPERGVAPFQRPAPQKGAEGHWILKTLRGVDGDDLDQGRVALQPQHRLLSARRLRHPRLQPAQQRRHALTLVALLLQQFSQVRQIGQPSLAVRQRQQAFRHPFPSEEMPPGRHESPLAPKQMVCGVGLQLRFPARLVLHPGQQFAGVDPGQFRHQRRAQTRLAGRLRPSAQQGQHLAGLAAGEHAFLGQRHAGHAALRQGLAHPVALTVGGHQHRDIAAGQRPSGVAGDDGGAAVGGQRQQARDLVGAGVGRQFGGVLAAGGFVRLLRLQPLEAERRPVVVDLQPAAGGRLRRHRLIGDAFDQKRQLAREQGVDGAHQRRLGPAVGVQRVMMLRVSARRQIGEDVCAAKAVDGLFRVAHQEDRPLLRDEAMSEDRVLDGVRVLKLVDQRHLKAAGHVSRQQRAADRIGQRRPQVGQQIVEAAAALARPARAQLLVGPGDQFQLELGHGQRHFVQIGVPGP